LNASSVDHVAAAIAQFETSTGHRDFAAFHFEQARRFKRVLVEAVNPATGKPRDGLTKDGTMIYFACKHDCEACALKPKCCPNVPARKIARSVHEAARDKARVIAKTEAYAVSRRERKKVEMLFAHLKRILRLDRLRLRGPSGATDEFLLAATAQNLRKLAKVIPFPAPVFAT
jgi:Transposase DDE domain